MRAIHQIVLATLNPNKFLEFQVLFNQYPEIQLLPIQHSVRNPEKLELVEKHSTFLENAIAKARVVSRCVHYPVLSDDSGLVVEALQGAPGVFSHRFAPVRPGVSQDQANRELLVAQMKTHTNRKAQLVCTTVLALEGFLLHATGQLDGTLATQSATAQNGFGYDPLFIPDGFNKTLSEMTLEEKNAISHRSRALRSLMEQVQQHDIRITKP